MGETLSLASAVVRGVYDSAQQALLEAAADGDVAAMRAALRAGALVNDMYDGDCTALHVAAGTGHLEAVRLLLRVSNVDVNKGIVSVPLHAAAFNGHADVVRELLQDRRVDARRQFGTDRSVWLLPPANAGRPVVHCAAEHGRTEVVRVLLEDERVDPNETAWDGSTALQEAAINGHAEIVMALLQHPTTNVARYGTIVLREAIERGRRDRSSFRVLELLVNHPEISVDDACPEPRTSLDAWATAHGRGDIKRVLNSRSRLWFYALARGGTGHGSDSAAPDTADTATTARELLRSLPSPVFADVSSMI